MNFGKKLRMPSAYSILLIIILLLALLTQFIDGVQRASLAQLIMAVPEGFYSAIEVCLFILVLGGFLGVINATGALNQGIASLVNNMKGKETALIPLLMFLFSIGGTTYGMAEETMAFYALITATMMAAGFDALTGAAVVLVGAGTGVLGSTVNPFAVSAAVDALTGAYPDIIINQGLIIGLGVILWFTSLAIGVWWVMRYAERVKRKGGSLMSEQEKAASIETYGNKKEDTGTITGKQKKALWIFGISFGVMVLALIPWESFGIGIFSHTSFLTGENLGNWYFRELQAWFFISSLAAGLICGLGEKKTIEAFVSGAADMIGVVFVIAVSRGISVIMQETGLDQFILDGASRSLAQVSPALFSAASYVIYLGLSFLIPSTSGLAAASMPTFGALTAGIGLRPEVMIMIFCSACGVVNLITPTSAVVMGGLAICRVEWPTWFRFIGRFLLVLIAVNLIILSGAMYIL